MATFEHMKCLLFVVCTLLLFSCAETADKGALLAQVNEVELYEGDIQHIYQGYLTAEDSAKLKSAFILDWIDQQILSQKALENELIDQNEIERKTESFKKDLLISKLEEVLVTEKLDTSISEQEIEAYYNDHQSEFELNDYLVKVLYLKISTDAPDIDKMAQHYKLRKEEDEAQVDIYAKIYAKNYYYDPDNWIYFDDLLKEIPLQDVNKDRFIMKRSKVRFEESGYYYFLNIIDYKLKNTISPISFERNNIKERIINKRVRKLREELKNEIISNAKNSNEVTIY